MNIAVAQSGGPTCAINASLVGVFKQAVKTPQIDAVFGSLNGIEGIINDQLIELKLVIKTNEDMELLRKTPSTVLDSCRYKPVSYTQMTLPPSDLLEITVVGHSLENQTWKN